MSRARLLASATLCAVALAGPALSEELLRPRGVSREAVAKLLVESFYPSTRFVATEGSSSHLPHRIGLADAASGSQQTTHYVFVDDYVLGHFSGENQMLVLGGLLEVDAGAIDCGYAILEQTLDVELQLLRFERVVASDWYRVGFSDARFCGRVLALTDEWGSDRGPDGLHEVSIERLVRIQNPAGSGWRRETLVLDFSSGATMTLQGPEGELEEAPQRTPDLYSRLEEEGEYVPVRDYGIETQAELYAALSEYHERLKPALDQFSPSWQHEIIEDGIVYRFDVELERADDIWEGSDPVRMLARQFESTVLGSLSDAQATIRTMGWGAEEGFEVTIAFDDLQP